LVPCDDTIFGEPFEGAEGPTVGKRDGAVGAESYTVHGGAEEDADVADWGDGG